MTIESRSEKLRIRKSSVLAFLVAGVRLGGLYAQLYEQQFEGGRIENRCEDGVVLSNGAVELHGREEAISAVG